MPRRSDAHGRGTASTASAADPVLVEATRGGQVESRHRGAAVVSDAAGKVVMCWGNIERPVYGRSAIKPLQALPLIESGAADRYALGTTEIALACASHHGEPRHVAAVAAWLARLGLDAAALECGAHPPASVEAAAALIRSGMPPSALHNNCSGKHTGFICTARHHGERVQGYIAPEHPVQQRVAAILAEMTGLDLARAPRGVDGCGIPVIGMPLAGIARAMARLADPAGFSPDRQAAARRVLDAMAAAPAMVAGTGGFVTEIMTLAPATVRAKNGAEGMYCAALPRHGLGVALKIDDGAGRAASVALGAILRRLGALDGIDEMLLAPLLRPRIVNVAGRDVGELRPAATLAGATGR